MITEKEHQEWKKDLTELHKLQEQVIAFKKAIQKILPQISAACLDYTEARYIDDNELRKLVS